MVSILELLCRSPWNNFLACSSVDRMVDGSSQPPPASSTHGKIRGYYVGHKILNSQDHYIYKTIEESEFDSTMECTITNLRRATEYSITVQAFNNKGAGPPSKDTFVKTHENDPPVSPQLRIVSSTSSTAELSWEGPFVDNNPVKGYKLFYKAELPEWDEIEIPDPSMSTYTLRSLNCGTKYQFHIIAYNDVGRSDPSDVVTLTTQGGSPIAPEKSALLNINTTFVILNLHSWKTGGCPISFFVVQYKSKSQREWVLVSRNLDPRHEEFVVTGLTPATWYNLLMSAHNEAGATEAEYVFATLTLAGGTITPPVMAEREEGPLFYKNLSVLVPIVCAVVVLLVITFVVLVVCLKRNRNPDYATPSQNQENRTEQKGDNISMASVGKKLYETPRETLYYPSPYATTRISMYSADSESSSGQTNSLQRPIGSQRPEHTYDVPFPQKQFRGNSSYSAATHDYQQLFTESGMHHFVESLDVDQRHIVVQRLCLQSRGASQGHQRSPSLFQQHHNHQQHEQQVLQQQHIYKYNRHSEPNSRFAHDYLSDGNSDEENSSSGEKACFQSGGNNTDTHEMSEAECDRDYHQQFRKNSQPSFVKFRIGPMTTNCGLCADNE